MSNRARGRGLPRVLLGDTDLFFFYLKGGRYESQAEEVVKAADSGEITLKTSSEVYDDAISAIRSDGASMDLAHSFVSDMRSVPHTALPMSADIAEHAVGLYLQHAGRRRLSYFDSFHVATARSYGIPLLTSDAYIIENAGTFQIEARRLGDWPRI